ncbi:Primosomal protein N' [Adhaeretor mobilis]|uniref:Replication restart protein PriA n=2 Tax=Adhaeretor mobilis TaxID=1930276 RepID=A0A517MZL6_9BACT|nr:Primosomal protein N' [Adhaeretor mobilis]
MGQQQNLFDDQQAEWELDAQQQRRVASIVIASGPDGAFDYDTPEGFCDAERPDRLLVPGKRVSVPFGRGNRLATGYCVAVETKSVDPSRLKPLARVLDAESLLSPAMLRLTRWMAEYYLCPWGQVLEAVVPAGVRSQAGTRQVKLLHVPPDVKARLGEIKLRSKQQAAALKKLATSDRPLTATELAKEARCTTGPVQQLLKHGLIEATAARVVNNPLDELIPDREQPLELNSDQQKALDATVAALDAGKSRGLLLHGVTGSGKTEVYLQAIEHVVSFGRQAIVLVPEISLTPQTVRRFRARFDSIAVLHSHLSNVERHLHWQKIARGEVQVIVGARSAVFAPTPHLGLIVIDEEHESTFKQDSAPRYQARDVAWQRATAEGIPLMLGSATPSLEAWQRAQDDPQFELLSLPKRVLDRPMPDVLNINLRDPGQAKFGKGGISRQLHQAMQVALRDQGQIILLLNRRGYSTHIQCPGCGFALKCKECEISLTYHRQHNAALCHYCDHEEPPPKVCPDCRSPAIRYSGQGTQKLEDEISSRFPQHTVVRMDTDSMRKHGSHEEVLSRFRAGEIDILLGTQMIAKGLDFPNVTLVGVVNADTALHLTDFRAAERTFQLVAQVAGRTGRGSKGGRVLVQTLQPEHPAIAAAARHDYLGFAAAELASREMLQYPPFGSMARIVVRGPDEEITRATAEQLADRVRKAARELEGATLAVRVLGPCPAPITKLRNEFRFHMQFQSATIEPIQLALRSATKSFRAPAKVRWIVDIDPWDMQ